MGINKVVFGGSTLIDLTNDTLSDPKQLSKGITAHGKNGDLITGTNEGGGMPSGFACGTVTITNTSTSSVLLPIIKTTDIGFTPRVFCLYRLTKLATNYATQAYYMINNGSSYAKHTEYLNNKGALASLNALTAWTTAAAGHLSLSGTQINVSSTSSYRCIASGTNNQWAWFAIE